MSNTNAICVIEDDALLGETITDRLRIEGLPFDWHRTAESAQLGLARRKYSAALCDLRLPDGSGKEIFESLCHEERPPFIFMTGFGTIDEAVSLLKSGAEDFVTKPFDLDALIQRLQRLIGRAERAETGPVLGLSPSMRKIETLIQRLTESVEPVLISGESGVGKEVISKLLHERSRAHRPGEWVAVNCAALPDGLIEAELFGYTRGAFTGAARAHKGLIEQANGGTLFLDEVGDMPLSMQSRLLRVLQERRVTRIGAESATPVDFRLVCATHRDLPAMVHAGQFREDLYYRINVIAIHIPPLRERREDILWLADKMLSELAGRPASSRKTLSLEAQQRLYAHRWPGNVRQLNHVLRRAIALGRDKTISASDLFQEDTAAMPSLPSASAASSLSDHLDRSERAYLVSVIQECDGAVGEAATRMGISRKTLWEKMKRHGIDRQHLERERIT
ncbi:MAG: sigma-54-dependent transcriptional regulator [Croceibacterium sp.]